MADYPFTTVEPVLGTVEAADGRQLTVADVPGLLEGASQGVGLGHEFLAHLERARLLVHLVDASAGAEDIDPRRKTIDRELALHGGGLAERPQLIVLSKIDLVAPDGPGGAPRGDRSGARLLGRDGRGHRRARARALPSMSRPRRSRRRAVEPELADFLVYRPQPPARREFRILRDGGFLRVAGRGIERRFADLDPEDDRAVGVLAAELERLGVDRALHAAGRPARRRRPGRRAPLHLPAAAVTGRPRIGVFGGRFDPPHAGHVAVAGAAMRQLRLDRLIVVPPRQPPHRDAGHDAAGGPLSRWPTRRSRARAASR